MKAIFITARTGSKRFPEKCLKLVAGRRAIERVIDRAKLSDRADIIVLCTTVCHFDLILSNIAKDNWIRWYRGSPEDKLMRWKNAAELFGVEFFVTFDGDDLLCDPELADLAFDQYDRTEADFIEARNVPTGAFTYGISTAALKAVCEKKLSTDTEMMVPYFKDSAMKFKIEQLEGVPIALRRPDLRMTMDYPEDLKFFENIYSNFKGADLRLRDVITYLDTHPEVIEINRHCQEKYLANQAEMLKGVPKRKLY